MNRVLTAAEQERIYQLRCVLQSWGIAADDIDSGDLLFDDPADVYRTIWQGGGYSLVRNPVAWLDLFGNRVSVYPIAWVNLKDPSLVVVNVSDLMPPLFIPDPATIHITAMGPRIIPNWPGFGDDTDNT